MPDIALPRSTLLRRTWERIQLLQTRWRYRGDRPWIVVHSLPRVGSIAVTRALRRRFPDRHVFHLHYLNGETIDEAYAGFTRHYLTTGRPGLHRHYRSSRIVRARLDRKAFGDWTIVSLVRDPVARSISAFFRHFPYNHPELGGDFHGSPENVGRLIDLFLDPAEREHSVTNGWFEREVNDVFGVDVFSAPFPRDGYGQVHSCDAGRLIVLRLEDLGTSGPDALGRFFGTEPIELRRHNQAADRAYAETYRRFLERLRLDDSYLDRAYGSRYARHFYDDEERTRFRARWSTVSEQ